MTPDVAAWIRRVVLPAAYLANTGSSDRCPCQYGPTGHCADGRHEQCPRTQGWHRHGEPIPDTHITNACGMVAVGPAAVWRSGTACRWLCSCRCHTEVMALFATPRRQPRRLSARGGDPYLRVASTDSTYRVDEQPALWEDHR